MTADQLLAWVDQQLLDYAPIEADAGEIRNRFSRVINGRKGGAFGFTIPSELAAAVAQPIAERFEAARADGCDEDECSEHG
jgi:hypothetical protein